MSKVRIAIVALFACLVPALAMAVNTPTYGTGNNSYLDRCEVPYPDRHWYYDHYGEQYLNLHDVIEVCRERTDLLPSLWQSANFTIHFYPSVYPDKWKGFECFACVRYLDPPGSWGDFGDLYTTTPRPIDISIADAVALFGGRVSQVRFISRINGETGELGGGYEVTLVNVDTGQTGVVEIDPFTGEATLIREEPISAEQ